jgi:hypothetical protein
MKTVPIWENNTPVQVVGKVDCGCVAEKGSHTPAKGQKWSFRLSELRLPEVNMMGFAFHATLKHSGEVVEQRKLNFLCTCNDSPYTIGMQMKEFGDRLEGFAAEIGGQYA